MLIRTATIEDLDAVTTVEAECFPPSEAATRADFEHRLSHYGDHFWLMFDESKLIAFVDGMVTDAADLTDEMYERAELHKESGAWQMIFGVNTIPEYRKHGYARQICTGLLKEGMKKGAQNAYLQVVEGNDNARALYRSLGFQQLYTYWFRVQPDENGNFPPEK